MKAWITILKRWDGDTLNLFNRKKSMTFEQLIDFLQIGGVDSSRLSEATYFACLKVLSESIGKLPLKLMQYTEKGGVIKAYKHPLYKLADSQPNDYMTATHFWSTVEFNRNHYGNAYVWIDGAGSKTRLWILDPGSVTPYIDDKGLWGTKNALWYVYNSGTASLKISSDSMLHFKTSASSDGVTGKSVRDVLRSTIEGNQKAQAMLNRAYENGFTGKAVLQYTGELSDANEKKFAKKIEDFVNGEGSDKRSIIPMAYGTNLQTVNTKLADNEFLGLKKYSALQIAAAFGIKPNQINDYEKASYASAEAQQLAFYVDTLLYIIKQYEEEMNNKLLSDEETQQGYYFKFNVSVILRADLKTQMESLTRAVQGSLYTPNEARAFIDAPARQGGDRLLCNGTMIPVEMAGTQYQKGGE